MFKKLNLSKTKKPGKGDRRASAPDPPGAAVPYKDPSSTPTSPRTPSSPQSPGFPFNGSASNGSLSPGGPEGAPVNDAASGRLLVEAASKSDIDGVRQLLRVNHIDPNARNQDGDTALLSVSGQGLSKVVRYLLLHGADIEARDAKNKNPLYRALSNGHTGTVGVLLDYMHSVDTRPRSPFVMLRGRTSDKQMHFVENVSSINSIKGFKSRGANFVQLFIAHGQYSDDMSVFLYSILDVPVGHAFFLNLVGDLNIKNFLRFESRQESMSLTVLNTFVRSFIDTTGYTSLKSLILVSCGLVKLDLSGLASLELLDVRFNDLESLPESIKDCKKLRTLKVSYNKLKRLPKEIGYLTENLNAVDASHNPLRRLTHHIVACQGLMFLAVSHCELLDLPVDIGRLDNLDELLIHNNKLAQLPLSLAALDKLKRLSFHSNPLTNIPRDFPDRPDDVRAYLRSLQDDPVANQSVKLVLFGQEGVGKTTLLKALKRTMWVIPRTPNTPKTDGIEVRDIEMDGLTFKCFDCGGDVDFNETHNFFITQGALYLACFNLSEYCRTTIERPSFLLGRLQLWLQYIFSRVPRAQVLIVGTHADHESLKLPIFEEIWEQLRRLLVSAREHHRQYFQGRDRIRDCLLCQSDSRCLRRSTGAGEAGFVNLGYENASSTEEETSFNDGPSRVVSFPHIMGYYEVSSVKSVGNKNVFQFTSNQSIDQLKTAIKDVGERLISNNPQIPRKWAHVQESLQNHLQHAAGNSLATMDQVAEMAAVQGVTSRSELTNMLHFLKAQGNLLFFPQSKQLRELVILDPEWLAKIFASVISFHDTGISNEGFLPRQQLKDIWKDEEAQIQGKFISLLHYFGLCIPVDDTETELFPCKLPMGEPDESVWPVSPKSGQRQLTYSLTFPSLIPPPFFSDLIVAVYRKRHRDTSMENGAHYFSNIIVDCIKLEQLGCQDCGRNVRGAPVPGPKNEMLEHLLHFELIPHRRTIMVTVRGYAPCCMLKKAQRLLNKVASKYEGLGTIDLDTIICPGCYMQRSSKPHRFSAKLLISDPNPGEKVTCSNAHFLSDNAGILTGEVNESCLPFATIRPKAERETMDYSGCPKLFAVLPVNKDGLSFDNENRLFVNSLMFDGFAVHLLCEFPDGYHLTRSPGYRVNKIKEFMTAYGNHAVAVMRLLSHLSESSVVPSTMATSTRMLSKTVDDLVRDIRAKFKDVKDVPSDVTPELLAQHITDNGARFNREDLRRYLHIMDKPDSFGCLRRLRYEGHTLWLCQDHYKQLRVVTIGLQGGDINVESRA